MQPQQLLNTLFDIAVSAAQPDKIMPSYLPEPARGRNIVVGAGKASANMALAFEKAWLKAGHGALEGIIVTQYGYGTMCDNIEIIEAGHPIPDDNSARAAQQIMALVRDLGPDDQVIALISGGGSALLSYPPEELGLEGKKRINDQLLKSGASISEMNCVRKHFSMIKGGRLAVAAHPAKVSTLIISDVPGDMPHQVASGPTIADALSKAHAIDIINQYQLDLPAAAHDWLKSGDADAPDPQNDIFKAHDTHIIASAQTSLQAAQKFAFDSGIKAHILSDCIEGEAKDVATMHAGIVKQILNHNQPFKAPCILLSGGETTVSLGPDGVHGKGGRNSEFLLGFAHAIQGVNGVFALAADTDGIDGSEDNAGARCDGQTIARMRAKGLDPAQYLAGHDAFTAFEHIDDLLITGPTKTNVNDFRAILIDPDSVLS